MSGIHWICSGRGIYILNLKVEQGRRGCVCWKLLELKKVGWRTGEMQSGLGDDKDVPLDRKAVKTSVWKIGVQKETCNDNRLCGLRYHDGLSCWHRVTVTVLPIWSAWRCFVERLMFPCRKLPLLLWTKDRFCCRKTKLFVMNGGASFWWTLSVFLEQVAFCFNERGTFCLKRALFVFVAEYDDSHRSENCFDGGRVLR